MQKIIRLLILILVGHLCYGDDAINDFLSALHDVKYISYNTKDFAKFLVQCNKASIPQDFKKGFGPNLNGANFSQLYLSKSIFDGVSLIGADFSNTDLSDVSFIDVDLRGANFSNANLHGVKIKGTNLSFSKFASTNLTDIIFDQSNISYADFINSNLNKVSMRNIIGLHTKF